MFKIKINGIDYQSLRFQLLEDENNNKIADIVILGELPKENDLIIVWGAVQYTGIKTLPHFDDRTNTTSFKLYLGDR